MLNIILQAQQGNPYMQFVFFGAIILVFYFFMIRPQQKKAKEAKKFQDEIAKGDYVVTIGGAHGRIAEIEDDTFVLEVEKGGRIRFSKTAINMEASKVAQGKNK
ncbi:MAG: preprotein translocase subunit YajC [Cyclobacteriaceae bacterium]|jgi:preprotein translocase subunit YajC|nr:preprotein translocase subunit YajC [Cyclobacteriaceae bacterium]